MLGLLTRCENRWMGDLPKSVAHYRSRGSSSVLGVRRFLYAVTGISQRLCITYRDLSNPLCFVLSAYITQSEFLAVGRLGIKTGASKRVGSAKVLAMQRSSWRMKGKQKHRMLYPNELFVCLLRMNKRINSNYIWATRRQGSMYNQAMDQKQASH